MSEEKKFRLRDKGPIRAQVLKAWFRLDDSYKLTESERAWVDAGPLTATEHLDKLENVLHYEQDPFRFLSFLSGWEACLIHIHSLQPQRNEEEK